MQREFKKSEVGLRPQKFIEDFENPTRREVDAKIRFNRKAYGGVYEQETDKQFKDNSK